MFTRTQRISRLELGDRRTFTLFLRMLGYLDGAWEKSHHHTPWLDWDAARFSRKTGTAGGRKIAVRTLERQFPKFQRWCQEYYFTRVNVGGRWCVRITRNPYVLAAVPGSEVRERLVLAIRAYLKKGGRAKVDLEWCRKFSELSRLPLNAVEAVWIKLGHLDGLKHRWRGVGHGRKICYEDPVRWAQICAERQARAAAENSENLSTADPQTSPPVSISYGDDKIKTSGRAARSQTDRPPAAPAGVTARDEADRAGKSPPEPGGHEPPEIEPYFGRWLPGRAPLQICGRLVSPQRLQALAAWLAIARLKFAHAGCERVRFAFPHACNFARAALRFGYGAAAIEAAWRAGVWRSHEDALEADRLPGGGYASTRAPSAAQVYAWSALRGADSRSSEQLWAAFFAAAPVKKTPHPKIEDGPAEREVGRGAVARAEKIPSGNQEIRPTAAPRLTAAEAAVRLAELRAVVRPAPAASEGAEGAAPGVTAGELLRVLQPRGLTLAQFTALPWPRRQFLIAAAAALKASGGGK